MTCWFTNSRASTSIASVTSLSQMLYFLLSWVLRNSEAAATSSRYSTWILLRVRSNSFYLKLFLIFQIQSRTQLPLSWFLQMQSLENGFRRLILQQLRRQARAKSSLSPSDTAIRQVEPKMSSFLGYSKEVTFTRTQPATMLLNRYFSTKMYFFFYHSRFFPSLPLSSSPFVPHDKSSILQNANTCRKLRQVGKQQTYESTELSISMYLLKLKVHRTGTRCPKIMKTTNALKYAKGIPNPYAPGPSSVCMMMLAVLTAKSEAVATPQIPRRVEERQQSFLNLALLLLSRLLQSTLAMIRQMKTKLSISGTELTKALAVSSNDLYLLQSQSQWLSGNSGMTGAMQYSIAYRSVRFIETQNRETCSQLATCITMQQQSCKENRKEGLSFQ